MVVVAGIHNVISVEKAAFAVYPASKPDAGVKGEVCAKSPPLIVTNKLKSTDFFMI
jgi:hypothetical protein